MCNTFEVTDIKRIENATSVGEAREMLIEILDRSKKSKRPIRAEKDLYLRRSIERAPDVMEVVAIAYNMLLAGEGLASLDSRYFMKRR